MSNLVFKISDGSFVGIGHYVYNFTVKAVVVGVYHDLNGNPSPILRELVNGKIKGGKWVADPQYCRSVYF